MVINSILFDLDGTLLDTTRGVICAVRETMKEYNFSIPNDNILKSFVGPPMQLSFERYYKIEKNNALAVANRFREIYRENFLYMADLYPNTINVLKALKEEGYSISVATNKSHENAMMILKYFHISDYCSSMMGSDLNGIMKKADIINECIKEEGTHKENVVYVGDSEYDLIGANEAGVTFIGVTYGFGFNKGGKYDFPVIDNIMELRRLVRSFCDN